MNKNVLVVSSSLRSHSNSERLADEFVRGVQESGNYAEHISLRDKTIHFCKGCLTCQESQRCVIHDDADMIVQKMRTADVIVFATPIYYYEMSGQMKTLLDRANPKAHLAGTILGNGVDAAGTIEGHSALQEAYEMGKAI